MSVSVCVCVCPRSYLRNYASYLHQFFMHVIYVTCCHGSVLLWRRSDMLCISDFTDNVIFAHKLRLLDVAGRLKLWGSHAASGLARKNNSCRQWNMYDIMFAHNVPAYIATRKWRVLKVTTGGNTVGRVCSLWLPCFICNNGTVSCACHIIILH